VRTVAADFGSGHNDLEAEVAFDLLAHLLQQIAEELLNAAATQANYVSVFLFEARFVVVLVAIVVHEIELIHQTAGFEQFQCAVDGDAIDLGIFFARELVKTFGIEVLSGLIDEIEQDLALAGKPDALLFQ